MTIDDFFPTRPPAKPTIYAFASTHPDHGGLLKVGYTEGDPLERSCKRLSAGVTSGLEKL
jgi:hypothetical protein